MALTAFPSFLNGPVTSAKLQQLATAITERTPLTAYKIADEPLTSSITLQDDNHMTLTLVAGGVYAIRNPVWVGGDDLGDLRVNYTIPNGTIGWMGQVALLNPAGASTASDANMVAYAVSGTSLTSDLAIGIADTNLVTAELVGLMEVGGTGGAFTVRWAQVTSSVIATTVKRGSFLEARRIS